MLRAAGLAKAYRAPSGAPIRVLDGVDLAVKAGEVAAVTGASGSGKSTLLNLLGLLEDADGGELWFGDERVGGLGRSAKSRARGRWVGFVFQAFLLVPSLTALENVRVPMEIAGARDAERRGRALLDEVGLSERGHHYPSQLSGGEQQRVAIARALANDPPLLLADEPTGNLDSTTGRQVIDLLLQVNRSRGTTLVLVTHDADLAALADLTIGLRDGAIASRTARPPAS